MNWNYVREESPRVAPGDYRFEVISAVEKVSKSGKNMIEVCLKINGSNLTVYDYFVEGEFFNRKATSFFDATNIEEGNFDLITWVGAVGAARFKEDENGFLKVAYYIDKKRAERLPPWRGPMPERQKVTTIEGFTESNEPDDELPF